jgi:hypothetical protein
LPKIRSTGIVNRRFRQASSIPSPLSGPFFFPKSLRTFWYSPFPLFLQWIEKWNLTCISPSPGATPVAPPRSSRKKSTLPILLPSSPCQSARRPLSPIARRSPEQSP